MVYSWRRDLVKSNGEKENKADRDFVLSPENRDPPRTLQIYETQRSDQLVRHRRPFVARGGGK